MTGATSDGATDAATDATSGSSAPGVDPRFERYVDLWLRAYPRRWRAARAAEVTAVLADLAAPGARRLDLRSGLGLVRAGWATRWREHPPLLPWLGYRLLDRRLPAQHRAWVHDDLTGALLPWRTMWPFVAYMAYMAFRDDGLVGVLAVAGGLVLALWLFVGGYRRQEAIRRHLVLLLGEEPDERSLVLGWVYRLRYQAVAVMPLAAGVLTLWAGAGVAAAAFAHRRIVVSGCGPGCAGFSVDGGPIGGSRTELVVLAGALLVGTALVPLVRRRMLRLLPGPDQPSRWVVRVAWRHRAGAATLAAVGCGWAAAEASGHLVLLSTPGAVVCCLLAPGAVAAWLLLRARPELRLVAAVDVWRVAVRGRSPQVDAWVPGLVPALVAASADVVPGTADPA